LAASRARATVLVGLLPSFFFLFCVCVLEEEALANLSVPPSRVFTPLSGVGSLYELHARNFIQNRFVPEKKEKREKEKGGGK